MVSRGDVLAKAAVKSWLYKRKQFLKVSSIVQHFVVTVDFFAACYLMLFTVYMSLVLSNLGINLISLGSYK